MNILNMVMESINIYFPVMECNAGTYYTVVFGQLTTFGIFLAFYQFVAAQSDDKYLGQKISAKFMKMVIRW